MNIHLIEAEHFSVPGRIVRAFFEVSSAEAAAVEIVNKMLDDSPYSTEERATTETWEDWADKLGDWHGAAHCYVIRTGMQVETNPRRWSFLISWNDRDDEEGEYGWTGEADDREAALAAAYAEMFADNQYAEDGDVFDLEEFSAGRSVIEEWHGTNPWA